MKAILVSAGAIFAFALGLGGAALATHEGVTETHSWTTVVDPPPITVSDTILDEDSLPHPVTVTETVTQTQTQTQTVTVTTAPTPAPSGTVIKTLNSTNSVPVGLSSDSTQCTLTRPSGWDLFTMQSNSPRCTWTHTSFSQMGRREVFDVEMRFNSRPEGTDWEQEIMLRPYGTPFGNVNCSSGGNAETMLLRLWIDRTPSPDVWKLDIRGGESINLSDQVVTTLNLGSVVVGQTLKLSFDIVASHLNGAASVWKNDVLVYENRNRPVGFHYDCNRTTDLSAYALRMQHGVYRGGTGALAFTSSGFRFYLSQ